MDPTDIGVICMAAVANLQYGWTLFVNPIDAKYHWGRAAIQVAFSLFVLIETWLIPIEGYMVDRFGPRWVVLVGGVLVGVAWALNSVASSLPVLYFAAALGGIGTGCVYGTCVGNALKWFPGQARTRRRHHRVGIRRRRGSHRRPDSYHDRIVGLRTRLLGLRSHPGRHRVRACRGCCWRRRRQLTSVVVKPSQTAHGYTPMEVLKSPVFYVMYIMFVLIAAGGLTMAASMAPIAR